MATRKCKFWSVSCLHIFSNEESLLGVCRLSHLIGYCFCCCSVTQSCPTFCNCMDCTSGLSVHEWLSPWVCSNSCPLSQWCHSTILSSVALFSSCPQCLPASGSFPMSCLFASGHQSIRASASASVLPMNIQGWFPLGNQVWSLCCPKDSQESSPAPQFRNCCFLQ